MKTLCTWLMAFVLITEANLISAQLVNCNPDTNSMPWYSGGLKTITQSMQQEIDVIPKFILSPNSSATQLDSMVDNSILPYMPPIIYQGYQGICAQASLVAYMFTFEINRIRNVSASEPGNKYHPSFTYNFLNYGSSDSGSTFYDGLRILKEFGCPDSITYDRPIPNPNIREWISSYSKYFAALQNRISYYETINILSDTGIFCIKH